MASQGRRGSSAGSEKPSETSGFSEFEDAPGASPAEGLAGLVHALAEGADRFGLGDTLTDLSQELGSLGREVAAAGIAVAERAAKASASPDQPTAPRTETDANDVPTSGSPGRGARRPKPRSRRRTLRGERVDGSQEGEQASQGNEAAEPDIETALLERLVAAIGALGERLERTTQLVDGVTDLVEEQSERLETVEELLEGLQSRLPAQAASSSSQAAPEWQAAEVPSQGSLRSGAQAGPHLKGILLLDPDGVRAAVLAGGLRAHGVDVVVEGNDLDLSEIDMLGFGLAVHADADPTSALPPSFSDAVGAQDSLGRCVVYYFPDELGEDTAANAANWQARLACGAPIVGDAAELSKALGFFHD